MPEMRGLLFGAGVLVVAVLVYLIGDHTLEQADRDQPRSAGRIEQRGDERPRLIDSGGLVVDDRGAPLADAVVIASRIDDPHAPSRSAITNPEGRWSIDVQPERFRLDVYREGFLPHSEEVRLPASEHHVVRLARGGERVIGKVTDMFDQPIAEAKVEFLDDDDQLLAVAIARTDGTFAASTATKFSLARASHPEFVDAMTGYLPGSLTLRLSPGISTQGVAVREDGEPCREASVRFHVKMSQMISRDVEARTDLDGHFVALVPAGQAEVTAFGRGCASTEPLLVLIEIPRAIKIVVGNGYALTGHVTDRATHEPVAKARVTVDLYSRTASEETVTDDAGYFEFAGLPKDKLKVIVEHGDHMRSIGEQFDFVIDRTIPIELDRGRTLRGRIDPPAIATLGLDLDVFDSGDQTNRRIHDVKGTSKPDGTFELSRVPDGKHQLVAVTKDGTVGKVPVEVTRDRDDIRIELAPTGNSTLIGRVVDTSGAALAQQEVVVTTNSFDQRRTLTDSDGRFRIEKLPAEAVVVDVAYRERIDASFVTLGPATTQTEIVVHREDAVFRGRVVADRGPVGNMWVSVEQRGQFGVYRPGRALTRADGTFEITGMRRVPQTLRAESPSGDLVGVVDDVQPDSTTTIEAKRIASVILSVTREGKPVRGYGVDCKRKGARFATFAHTADGTSHVQLPGEGPVECRIEVEQWGALVTGTGTLDVALAPLTVVSGRTSRELTLIYFRGSVPAGSIDDVVRNGAYTSLGFIEEDGRFQLGIYPGAGTLLFYKEGSSVTRAVTGTSGGRVELGTIAAD